MDIELWQSVDLKIKMIKIERATMAIVKQSKEWVI